MSSATIRIDGKVYQTSDMTRVSALAILKASEELPALGLRTTWEYLVALLKRSMLPADQQGEWSDTDQLWMAIVSVWSTLNASGRECTIREAMDLLPDAEVIAATNDHQGKAKAPSRKGSGRGAGAVRKAPKTPS